MTTLSNTIRPPRAAGRMPNTAVGLCLTERVARSDRRQFASTDSRSCTVARFCTNANAAVSQTLAVVGAAAVSVVTVVLAVEIVLPVVVHLPHTP
jgi:hypothetical protein